LPIDKISHGYNNKDSLHYNRLTLLFVTIAFYHSLAFYKGLWINIHRVTTLFEVS